ncbi:putative quinol monooxygenase [Xanthobacteraceae bacterium Astr-EGSB]|uniref:putative quinol monooxygenase n=1 Tax=Astrobacterium formosum TaxID=3069710 RepID=UPI0027B5D69C|nr:putative quinol monooxygenase [Xanthobacteraceae bacterium Astr-EGSB]
MYIVTVDFTISPGRLADFLPLMLDNARVSREREPGCRQFDVCRSPEQPQAIFLYEVYDDAGAFQMHLDSAHFRAFDAAVRDMIASKQVRVHERLGD